MADVMAAEPGTACPEPISCEYLIHIDVGGCYLCGGEVCLEHDEIERIAGYAVHRVCVVRLKALMIDGVTGQQFLDHLFEFELCVECGKDADAHTAIALGLGDYGRNWFARCGTL